MHLILLGAAGTGKGTQAKLIKEKFGYYHLVASDLIKDVAYGENDSPYKAEAIHSIEKGSLVSDSLIVELIRDKIKSLPHRTNVIFDGFPRSVGQAQALIELIEGELKIAFFLTQTEGVLIKRLTGRLICSKCGVSFHETDYPPIKQGTCNECFGALKKRVDDTEEVIKERLTQFKEKTAPVADYLKDKTLLVEIKHSQTPEETFETIQKTLSMLAK